MRSTLQPLFLALVFVLASHAAQAALNVSVSSPQLGYFPGDLVTIDIYIETTGPEAQALGLRAADYDPSILTSGTATIVPSSIFDFSPSIPFGGLNNSASGVEEAPGGPRPGWSINLFQGVSGTPAAGSGPEHFQITFIMGGVGVTTINVGALSAYADAYGGGDNVVNNTSITIFTAPGIPEPGTALLLGLGLMGLGATSPRRRHQGEDAPCLD
ncbi:MAG: PEP-CTERM sorting domain-containing protein [Myxococcota bacterium]